MSFIKRKAGSIDVVKSILEFDEVPTEGSHNLLESGDVAQAIGNLGQPLQWKGPATVAALNAGITGIQPGWTYTLTDEGTLTDGSIAVEAGDEVAWTEDGEWFQVGPSLVELKADVVQAKSDIADIQDVVPEEASESNKLVTKDELDNVQESIQSGFTPKGEISVSDLNDLTTQSNGDQYILNDSGTITDGSVAVEAGDSVAWNSTDSVWYKVKQYALSKYGTDEIKNLQTSITAFRTGDVIPVDGPDGTAKMSKDDLLKETAQNAVAGNVAPAFDPTRTNTNHYAIGDPVVYNGAYYRFIASHYGAWNASHVVGGTYDELKNISQSASFSIVGANITGRNKYIFLPKGLNNIRITPTPNPWPTDTIGGDNPSILIIYAVSSDGTETALKTYPIGSTIPETIVASIPSSAVMLRFFIRANIGEVVSFSVVDAVENDITELKQSVTGLEGNVQDLQNYLFSTIGSVQGKGATEIASREFQVKGLSTVTVDFSSNLSWPTSQLLNNTAKFWLQAYASGAWSTIFQAGKTSTLMKFVVDIPINATKIRFYTRCNTGTTLSYTLSCVETATTFTISGLGGTAVNRYFRVKPSTKYFLIADKSWDVTGISSTSVILNIYASNENLQEVSLLSKSQAASIPATEYRFAVPDDCHIIKMLFRAVSGVSVTFNLTENYETLLPALEYSNLVSLRYYNGYELPGLLLMGDPHSDNAAYRDYLKIINNKYSAVSAIVVLGDMANDHPTQSGTYDNFKSFVNASSKKVLPVIGNHDIGSGWGLSAYAPVEKVVENIMSDAVARGFIPSAPKGYYYVDIGSAWNYKVRIIVLNNYNIPGVYDSSSLWERVEYDSNAPTIELNTNYSQGDVVNVGQWTDYSYRAIQSLTTPATSPTSKVNNYPCWEVRPDFAKIDAVQAQWLLDTMASTPNYTGVVIVQHSTLATSCKKDLTSKFTQKNGPALNVSGVGDFLVEAAKAFEEKNASFTYPVQGEEVSKDFSGRASTSSFVGFLGGHEHHDYIVRSNTYPKYYEIVSNKSKLSYAGDNSDIFTQAGAPSATFVAINRETKSVSLAKIGVQFTQDGYKRDIDVVKQESPAD